MQQAYQWKETALQTRTETVKANKVLPGKQLVHGVSATPSCMAKWKQELLQVTTA